MSAEQPQSPTLASLPRIPQELADGVAVQVHQLKHVVTEEKNVLPTKDVHRTILESTRSAPARYLSQEKQHYEFKTGIQNFQRGQLKRTDTEEKQVLPSCEDVALERQHEEFKQGIESFHAEQLRTVKTEEKVVLPSKEDIVKEKVPHLAAHFDKGELHHVEPTVKSGLPTPEEYAREKVKSLAAKYDHKELKHIEPTVKTGVEVIDESH
uniref:Beta-casein n=1 Tax=Steinernema glaseri TaxID=37863 RepID=A0A1I7YX26_9BILA